jgi:two-component system sensor histidine kinase/response regulator
MIPHPPLPLLVIEDDASVRQTLVDILELNGYVVRAAGNGAEGRAMALAEPPALIITDIEMPGLTGFELLQFLRASEELRTIPVIVISAKVDRAATRRGMELGADDFITKPFTEDEVIHSVRTRLEKKELLDELDAFAHTVAHDLKNPLATLNGRLGLLELTLDSDDRASLRHHVKEASVAASRLAAIIDELLVLAGVRRQRVEPAPVDMGAAVAEALDRIEDLLRKSGAAVERPAEWPAALGHFAWVTHVWTNYIGNAAKHAGPCAQITLGYTLPPEAGRVRFWVRDRGPGLDAEARAKLFVPFTRISSVRASGHGLGLSIVRRIVEKLGGAVGVESEPGQGSCFWFELPVAK